MTQEQSDPVIDEVREVRRRISARFDNDPARLVAYYMKQQERHRERLMDPVKRQSPRTSRPLDLALQRGLPAVSVNGIIKATLGRPVR